jgi:CHAD domain-containing protein
LKLAELETLKQKLDLFDFLTPNECRALIEGVEQLQEELGEILDLTIALQQRLPTDERSLAQEERINDACPMLSDEGEHVFLKVAS